MLLHLGPECLVVFLGDDHYSLECFIRTGLSLQLLEYLTIVWHVTTISHVDPCGDQLCVFLKGTHMT